MTNIFSLLIYFEQTYPFHPVSWARWWHSPILHQTGLESKYRISCCVSFLLLFSNSFLYSLLSYSILYYSSVSLWGTQFVLAIFFSLLSFVFVSWLYFWLTVLLVAIGVNRFFSFFKKYIHVWLWKHLPCVTMCASHSNKLHGTHKHINAFSLGLSLNYIQCFIRFNAS